MYFLNIIRIYNEHTKLILPWHNGIQLNNADGPIYYPYYFPPVTPQHIHKIYTLHAGAYNDFEAWSLQCTFPEHNRKKKPHFVRTKSKVNEKRNSII